MTRKNYRNDRIEIVDVVQTNIENKLNELKNEIMSDEDFAKDFIKNPEYAKELAEKAVSDKVKAENKKTADEVSEISELMAQEEHRAASNGSW